MLDVYVEGMESLRVAINTAKDIPPDVMKAMVQAMGKVTEEAVVYNAATMLQGPYYEGDVARSVKAQSPRATKNGATVIIKFVGEAHGNRMGEIAFINEYGKKSQPARPFIKKSIKEAEDPGADEAHKILDEWLKTKNL